MDEVTPAGSARGWRISLGVCAGLLAGFFWYVPAVILWQHYFDVPRPRVYPHGSFTLLGLDPPPASYWVSWAAPALLVVVFGLVTVSWRAARQFAVPFVLAFLPIAALAAWFVVGMDLFFTPD
ncbi:hypothetical protein R1X32_02825 (plasmid) [Rhodococcus opacus]|uniref:hypothetical protein n=1 Tax=Rhodococcus opacus TaxID=37919 RepID=UPI00146BA136|nr:hypothetical protein HJ581_0046410 [Rhodococcus opacus]